MFETLKVLVIIHANDVDRFESLSRVHGDDPRVRVMLDRRRASSEQRPPAPAGVEARPLERRSPRPQPWQDGHLVIETGFPE
jgi:hypothetical protein